MVDYGCDNGRLFCVLTMVENLSSLRGRKTNEEKNKLSVCNPAKPAAFMWCADWGLSALCLWIWIPVKGITHAHTPPNLVSSIFLFPPQTHICHTFSHLQRCSYRYTRALLCIPAIFYDFKFIKDASGIFLHLSKKKKKEKEKMLIEYIKWIFRVDCLTLKHWISKQFQNQHMVSEQVQSQTVK